MRVGIDAGHGMGNRTWGVYDPGAVRGDVQEAHIALAVERLAQRGLLAGFNGTRRRQRGDHGLAAAHVALHQPVRGPVLRQVGLDLAPHPLLRRSQRKRQRGQQACHQIARGRQRGG